MSILEFKEKALFLLNYCIDETMRVCSEDYSDSDDEEKMKANAYCEGIKDSIEKINSIHIEETSEKTLVVFQDLSNRHATEVAWIKSGGKEELEAKIRNYASKLEEERFASKFVGFPIRYEITTF